MEQRITSLLLPAPEAELEASCKELDEKVTWLLHNSRKMDNYLELEPFSKDGRLCAHVCDTLKSLPETPTLAAYKDYKAIIILLGMSTTHYAILDELAEQHRKRDEIPELTAYCDALHWMRPGRQYLCNVYNTVCHAFHLLRRNPVRDNRLLVTEKELRHAERRKGGFPRYSGKRHLRRRRHPQLGVQHQAQLVLQQPADAQQAGTKMPHRRQIVVAGPALPGAEEIFLR